MGDKHVCSFCGENLEGKQHIKIVFENWPVEEEITYRRKGKEVKKTRTTTKEVITAIGMECANNPEKWKDYDIDPNKVADFFEDLRLGCPKMAMNCKNCWYGESRIQWLERLISQLLDEQIPFYGENNEGNIESGFKRDYQRELKDLKTSL